MLTCDTCRHYINPQRIMEYTIGEHAPENQPQKAGWVTCAGGSIVNRTTMGCDRHTDTPKDTGQRRTLVHTPDTTPPKRRLIP
ncbi:hypothetical protein LCGC14_1240750 [marine sediment metagenome]|uniref:Uncharacterized protein n=1 Tax=marine sediment metagenome TaxID=412755 RepID=A0A0F9NN19_9ZZZZ